MLGLGLGLGLGPGGPEPCALYRHFNIPSVSGSFSGNMLLPVLWEPERDQSRSLTFPICRINVDLSKFHCQYQIFREIGKHPDFLFDY